MTAAWRALSAFVGLATLAGCAGGGDHPAGGGGRPTRRAPAATFGLSVLRRPQTRADELPGALSPAGAQPRYTRLLGRLADRRFYLVTVAARVGRSRQPQPILLIAELLPHATRAISIGGATSAREIRAGHVGGTSSTRSSSGSYSTWVVGLVPDGVARVTVEIRSGERQTLPATRNFFAAAFRGRGDANAPMLRIVTWHDARGRVVKAVRYP